MKTLREMIDIVEAKDANYNYSVFMDLQFIAGKNRSTNMGAANYLWLIKNDDDNLTNTSEYYERTVEPFLQKYNYPPLHSEDMAKAQQEIVDNWKNEKLIKGNK